MASIDPPPRSVAVAIRHPRWKDPARSIRRLFLRLDSLAPSLFLPDLQPGELSIALVDDDEIARIHADFMGDPTPTDVITFPGDPSTGVAGEICVSVDAAQRESERRKLPFSRELTLYLVHGWLHLLGLDDIDPTERRRMRAAEGRVLRRLEKSGEIPELVPPAP